MRPARSVRRWWKWALIPLGALFLIEAAVALFYAFGLDPYARRYVERLAGDALRVPVRIDRAQVRIRGRSALTGISIVNPAGYRESEACRFDRVDGYLEAGTIFRRTLEMRDLVAVHPVLTVDFLDGRSNFAALIGNLAGDPADPQAVPPAIPGQKFRVSRARVIDGVVRFRSSDANGGYVSILLPDLDMGDFGDAPGSEPSTARVLALIFEAMAGSVLKSDDPSIPVDVRRAFSKELRKLSR
ncbi:MAG TPA: hypothetical protein VG457_04510 [Planctomycetota bacterium]|jgi:hypothetical protein|nr:hypothetical protein [Planctomycetota bacterium]